MVTIMVTDMDEAPEIIPRAVTDVNVAPEFASATTSRTVAENTAASDGHRHGTRAATDNDGDTLDLLLGRSRCRVLRHRPGHRVS